MQQGDKQPSFDDGQTVTMGSAGLTLVPCAPDVPIDLGRLIETKLLVQANSGGGKTYAIRRLLEQTFGKVQHLVIDPEGEMHTLREKYDYVLAAPKGGDCIASVATAGKLAERLLELGASAIIDIYDLGPKRTAFVRHFLEALMNVPRDMWAPAIVVIEEAHKFCPERGEGEAESTEAVKDLMTRGRKRGFCGVLATQRLSSLHKSAAAECNNMLIGRTALDNDQERACKALGFKVAEGRDKLRHLDDGHFFAFGPALSKTVTEIKVGAVQTTHEKAGQKRRGATPPRERVRQILSQLADLPAEAEAEAKTVEMLKAQLERARAELARSAKVDPDEVLALKRQVDELRSCAADDGAAIDKATNRYTALAECVARAMAELRTGVDVTMPIATRPAGVSSPGKRATPPKLETFVVPDEVVAAYVKDAAKDTRPLVIRMLTVLRMWGPLKKTQILLFLNLARSGRATDAFAELEANDYWAKVHDTETFALAERGRALVERDYQPLAYARELREQIATSFGGLEERIFRAVCHAYPSTLTRAQVLELVARKRSGATTDAFALFVRRGIFTIPKVGAVRAADELFWTVHK